MYSKLGYWGTYQKKYLISYFLFVLVLNSVYSIESNFWIQPQFYCLNSDLMYQKCEEQEACRSTFITKVTYISLVSEY